MPVYINHKLSLLHVSGNLVSNAEKYRIDVIVLWFQFFKGWESFKMN